MQQPGLQLLSSWDIEQNKPPQPLYTFNKDFPFSGDTINIFVFVFAKANVYEVISNIEARSSGPYEYIEGTTQTIADALEIARRVCLKYDNRYR